MGDAKIHALWLPGLLFAGRNTQQTPLEHARALTVLVHAYGPGLQQRPVCILVTVMQTSSVLTKLMLADCSGFKTHAEVVTSG